jgi:hypothetical protein
MIRPKRSNVAALQGASCSACFPHLRDTSEETVDDSAVSLLLSKQIHLQKQVNHTQPVEIKLQGEAL